MFPSNPELEKAADEEVHLMQAAVDDLTQFGPLYERYFVRIYRYCLRRVGTAEEAEDLTSVIFTRALVSIGGYRGGSVAAWLFQIAHNATVNHLRSRRPHLSIDDADLDFVADTPAPLDEVMRGETQQALRDLVATLPDDQQNLLALKMVAGLNAAEIGQVIGKNAGTVRVELHRIISKLRTRYDELELE
ncbi:MAG: sigma-70 family RNA polymerase sigma factor [Chloroflexi bacterium]|nr:sigma-70 family RNA polymerase sigma factor [Chloroflexota bacterium]